MSDLHFELKLLSDSSIHKMISDIHNILASRKSDYSFAETDDTWIRLANQLDSELERRIIGEAQEDE